METELKDVLHLYIGCEVQTNYKRHTSSGLPLKKLKGTLQEYDLYMPDKCGVLLEDTSDKTHYSTFDIKTIKPLLRPLSDINFEEMKYIFKLPENSTFIKKNQYNKGVSIEYRWISEKGWTAERPSRRVFVTRLHRPADGRYPGRRWRCCRRCGRDR